jgi:acyl-CoA dehydrogenase
MDSLAENTLSDHLRDLKRGVRRIVEAELEPLAREIDRIGDVPDEAWRTMRKHGLLGMRLPEEFGGANLDVASYLITLEELSRSHRMFALMAEYTSGGLALALLRYGTPAQHTRWLRDVGNGTIQASFALTEPDAGSDAAAIRTRARKTADGWVLSGRKHFISNAHKAGLILVLAVTDAEKRARGGISAFLVPKDAPGFAVTRVDTTIGSEAIKLAELTFESCELPNEALLGPVGDGFKVAMTTLVDGRLGVGCACIGASDRVLDMMIEHANTRHTFGEPLANRQAIQWMIADSAMELAATRALVYQTILAYAEGQPVGASPSMCKVYSSEMAGRVTDRAVQVFGGMGLIRGFPVERFYRDVRHYRVGEGSSEVQRIVIARECLGTGRAGRQSN